MFAVGNAPFATQCLTETGTQPWISSLREWNPHNKTTIWGRGIVLCWDWVSLPFGASVSEAQFPGSRLFVLREASGLLTRGVCHYHILFTKKSQPNFSKFVRFCCMRPLLSLWRPVGSYRGSPSAIHEVLILLSRLWADSAYGRLYHSRGFDLVLRVPRVGERYKPRELAPCATPAERSKPRALEQAESWLSEIKTSQIAAHLSVGGKIKTSYIHYIYSIHIVFPEIKTS